MVVGLSEAVDFEIRSRGFHFRKEAVVSARRDITCMLHARIKVHRSSDGMDKVSHDNALHNQYC